MIVFLAGLPRSGSTLLSALFNIVHPHPDDDTVHGLPLHTIRSTISRRDYAVA